MASIGEHGSGLGQDSEGGQEQALEQDGTGTFAAVTAQADRQAIARDCGMVLRAALASVDGVGTGQVRPVGL